MILKRIIVSAGLAAGWAIPLVAFADEWEYRRESNRYQTDVDLDDYSEVEVDVDDDDGFDVDVGDRRYRVDIDDFDVDRTDTDGVDVDVDDDDGWEVSVRNDRGYVSDRARRYERYDLRPSPYDRYERGYARRGYGTDDRSRFSAYDREGYGRYDPERRYRDRFDAYDRDRFSERRDIARGDEFVRDRGVGQYYGSTTPEERYYNRGSEYFSRTTPPVNQFSRGGTQQRVTVFRDGDGNRYATRYERWTDTGRDRWYDEDNSGTAYTYDYEIEYDVDYDD